MSLIVADVTEVTSIFKYEKKIYKKIIIKTLKYYERFDFVKNLHRIYQMKK